MNQSSQKFIARNRAPRVQIEYDVETYGSEKKVQLPFVMAVLADLAGRSERRIPDVAQRRFADTHRFREIMSSGFAFPSMPDVHFSVMSNKGASTEGDNGKGLLERVDEARSEQLFYPYTFLRRGKRTLHGLWDGEEVLARRTDGTLEFDWEMVGETGNVARPPWFEMGLRTRVANNEVGAARTSAISDEQAVVLWDRLLEGVKFRVAVPGATAASVALA